MLNLRKYSRNQTAGGGGISKVSEGVMSFSGAISKALVGVFIASYDSDEAKIQLTEQQFKKLNFKLAYI